MQILREKVKECYMREGVNHMVNCREVVDVYWEAIKACPGCCVR